MLLGILVASILRNILTGKGVMRAAERVGRAGRGYNAIDHTGENFQIQFILGAISRLLGISIKNLDLMVFIQEISPWLQTKKIDETIVYLLEKIKYNNLMIEKHKK